MNPLTSMMVKGHGRGESWSPGVPALLTVRVPVDVGADELQCLLHQVDEGDQGQLQQVGALVSGP